ncbi:MAG TPA: STAS domain-containing protein [Solirubrobacteraceae bacterium]|jgi:anti-anti-sigma factor|nr:STAS domain-containing protein [Solirubrobacteraceae bacterium]
MSSYLGIDIEDFVRDGVHTLSLSGELDLAAVPSLEAQVRRVCAQASTRGITLDLGGLCFIDSTGLAAIVLVSRLCAKYGFSFELIPGPRAVQRLFESTGLIDALPFRAAPGSGDDQASGDGQARGDELASGNELVS